MSVDSENEIGTYRYSYLNPDNSLFDFSTRTLKNRCASIFQAHYNIFAKLLGQCRSHSVLTKLYCTAQDGQYFVSCNVVFYLFGM